MNSRKTFFYSFLLSVFAAMGVFALVYITMSSSLETDTPQQGVPMGRPGIEDSKTILLCIEDDCPYFLLMKFNAIENRVGIAAISQGFEISGISLGKRLESAGAMQCLMDLEAEYGIAIDYYLQCPWQQLSALVEDMDDIGIDSLGENLPQSIRNYLLKGADKLDGKSLVNAAEKAAGFMDNEIGLAFIVCSRKALIENNMEKLASCAGGEMKKNYSDYVTNINTQELKRMDRIINFLSAAHVTFDCAVIVKGDSQSHEKINSIIQ